MRRKILLDECVDRNLAALIKGHDVANVRGEGWSSLKNGELLKTAQSKFDIFLTIDQNLAHQQNLSQFSITVVVLKTRSSNIDELRKLIPELLEILKNPKISSPTLLGV